ncbi:hypothetical protein [Pseudoalteromonas xiamenensis]
MDGSQQLEQLTKNLVKPYVITRSKLGSTTKVIERDFVCNINHLNKLCTIVTEKAKFYRPTRAGFQYLVSFDDATHIENTDIQSLSEYLEGSDKRTDKVIFSWQIAHDMDGIENEMSITIRISNPMNPFVILQAALSKDHSEADALDFEDGSISVSIHGATQTTAEEIFALVSRWSSGCSRPQSMSDINVFLRKHIDKFKFANTWLLPIFCTAIFAMVIQRQEKPEYSLLLIAIVSFFVLKDVMVIFNQRIERWLRYSTKFSLFSLTGGDENQQTAYFVLSSRSTKRLIGAAIGSLTLNLLAGGIIWYLTKTN